MFMEGFFPLFYKILSTTWSCSLISLPLKDSLHYLKWFIELEAPTFKKNFAVALHHKKVEIHHEWLKKYLLQLFYKLALIKVFNTPQPTLLENLFEPVECVNISFFQFFSNILVLTLAYSPTTSLELRAKFYSK